jgi:hypothetical protein
MKYVLIVFQFLLIFSTNAFSDIRISKIYAIGKTDSPPLFTQKTQTEERPSGITHESAEIMDPNGKVILTEESDYRGVQLIHQLVKKFLSQEAYEVSVDTKKVIFRSFYIQGDKLVPADPDKSEDLEDNFITGPVLEPFLQKHWDAILEGDTVHVRLGVMELSESVGFKFWDYDHTTISGQPLIDIRLKASSIFIAMAVHPIDLFFDPIKKRLLRYKGRTPLKVLSNGKWVPLDAEIIYQ